MSLKTLYERHIDEQHQRPSGVVGRIIGNRMARQHEPENLWTISLLSLHSADTVLEVGFGPGIAIEQIAAYVTEGHTSGIDLSHTMVRVARKRNAQAVKAGSVDLSYGEAEHLPFADDTFNKALSIHTLYFWPNPLHPLKRTSACAQTKGIASTNLSF